MVVKIDLVGEKFGYLTVLREDASVNGRLSWFCSCVCGKTLSVKSNLSQQITYLKELISDLED